MVDGRWSMVALVALLAGCPRPPDEPAPRILELEPIYFTATRSGDRIEVKSRAEDDLFSDAEADFRRGRYTRAREAYVLVARDSSDSYRSGLAWFNIALCDLALGRPGSALEALDKAEPLLPDDRTEVLLLQMQAGAVAGEWPRCLKVGEELLGRELPPLWEARVHSYVGQAHFLDGSLQRAEGHFALTVKLILSSTYPKDQKGDALLASAYFRQALVYRALFTRIPIRLPTERMALDITDKLALMRKAEEQFLNAVRVREPEWSPRAGYESARLYETFARDLLSAEVPTDLTQEELQVYTEELNLKVVPILRRGREVLARNVAMCDQFGFDGNWKKESSDLIESLDSQIENLSPRNK